MKFTSAPASFIQCKYHSYGGCCHCHLHDLDGGGGYGCFRGGMGGLGGCISERRLIHLFQARKGGVMNENQDSVC